MSESFVQPMLSERDVRLIRSLLEQRLIIIRHWRAERTVSTEVCDDLERHATSLLNLLGPG